MSNFFDKFKRTGRSEYDLWKLIDTSYMFRDDESAECHIFCDIDKTYLETEFENVFQMAKLALETAQDKVTVVGASTFLQFCRWGNASARFEPLGEYPRPLHFVSSSPPQLRRTLETKFTLDHLDWSSDTFKNQAYNIRKGRFDLLRQQVTYKTAAILSILSSFQENKTIYLIGDSSESDAFIYLGLKLYLEKRIDADSYIAYLMTLEVSEKSAKAIVEKFQSLEAKIGGIFIRQVSTHPLLSFQPLSKSVFSFANFFEASLMMLKLGLIPNSELPRICQDFHNRHGLPLSYVLATLKRFSDCLSSEGELRVYAKQEIDYLENSGALKLSVGTEDLDKELQADFSYDPDQINVSEDSDILKDTQKWLKAILALKA